jgi:proline utilization trans-activator
MRMAITEGLHTDMKNCHHSEAVLERCREIWWTIYVLDCHMSSLIGSPLALAEREISMRLPDFASSTKRSVALAMHVQLASIIALSLGSKPRISYLLNVLIYTDGISCVQ